MISADSVERNQSLSPIMHNKLSTTSRNHWMHEPPPIHENERASITYDLEIPTDISTPRCRLDIVLRDKEKNLTYIIEVGVPGDIGVVAYEREKLLKYQRLKYEIRRMWGTEVKIVPIVVGATGAVKESITKYLQELPCQISHADIIKEAQRHSIAIIRKVLGFT